MQRLQHQGKVLHSLCRKDTGGAPPKDPAAGFGEDAEMVEAEVHPVAPPEDVEMATTQPDSGADVVAQTEVVAEKSPAEADAAAPAERPATELVAEKSPGDAAQPSAAPAEQVATEVAESHKQQRHQQHRQSRQQLRLWLKSRKQWQRHQHHRQSRQQLRPWLKSCKSRDTGTTGRAGSRAGSSWGCG